MLNVELFTSPPAIETLLKYGPNDTIEPMLATSWEVSSDKKSMIFHLRKGVKFHDGTDFNAAAVKWNLDEHKKINRPELELVTSVDVIDDYTVRVNLSQYSSVLLQYFAHYVGLIVSPTSIQKNGVAWGSDNVVGTGPFKLVSFNRDISIKYEKFSDYWDKGKPYVDRIEFDFIPDKMVVQAAFLAGTIDMYRIGSSSLGKVAYDLQNAGLKIDKSPGPPMAIWFDSRNPDSQFSNLKVREAVEYAIDKAAIAKALGWGFMTPITQAVPQGVLAYNPAAPVRDYNPDKARKLLTEAGYPNGFSTSLTVPTAGSNIDAATAVQGFLATVGIKAEVNVIDPAKMAEYRSKGWKNGIVLYATSYPTGNFAGFVNRETPPDYSLWPSTQRPAGYGELINKIFAATDDATMTKLNQELVKLMADDVIYAPIFVGFLLGIKQPWVKDETMCVVHQMAWYPAETWLDGKK